MFRTAPSLFFMHRVLGNTANYTCVGDGSFHNSKEMNTSIANQP